MIKLLVGDAGSGKTKKMIAMANESMENAKGDIVYIDITSKHMHQLSRNIRFSSTEDFNITTLPSLYGFLCGLVTANYDIEQIYIDGLDKIVGKIDEGVFQFLELTEKLSNQNDVDIYLSTNIEDAVLAQKLESYIIKA